MQGRERGEIETRGRGGEIQRCGGENRQGRGCNKIRVRRARQGVGDYIFEARNVENVAGEFGNIGKMARLSGEPQWRESEKGKG